MVEGYETKLNNEAVPVVGVGIGAGRRSLSEI